MNEMALGQYLPSLSLRSRVNIEPILMSEIFVMIYD
jgi:hypothetical protein